MRAPLAAPTSPLLWLLPCAAGAVLLAGVLGAASLCVVLRPPPAYVLPLLVDVAAHAPERVVLAGTLTTAAPLVAATVLACALHARVLAAPTRSETPTPRSASGARERRARSAARAAVAAPVLAAALGALVLGAQLDALRATSRAPLAHLLALRALGGARSTLAARPVYAALTAYWACAAACLAIHLRRVRRSPHTLSSPSSADAEDDSPLDALAALADAQWVPCIVRYSARWLSTHFRALCVSGQAVCALKIAGLWLALDHFSIAQRHLIRLLLLATLAFVEYSAVVLFALFLAILAFDLRACAELSTIKCASSPTETRDA